MTTTADRVHELVQLVEAGKFLEAFEEFYAEDVVMQENGQAPYVGKAAARAKEEAFVSAILTLHEQIQAEPLGVNRTEAARAAEAAALGATPTSQMKGLLR